MSWSYDNPGANNKDWVRFKVGDTDTADQLTSNEEIRATLGIEGNRNKTAVIIARAIAAKFSRSVDKQVGPLRISASQKAKAYIEFVLRPLEAEMGGNVAAYAGGISKADIRDAELDTDREAGAFKVGKFDIPGAEGDFDDDPLLSESFS